MSYLGHSMGCTSFAAGAALMPDYFNSKINVAILMAPVLSMKFVDLPFFVELAHQPVANMLAKVIDTTHSWNMVPNNWMQSKAS